MERVKIGIVGHSFVCRPANYALLQRSMNLDLKTKRFEVTFVARGRLKVQQLSTLTHNILKASRDVIFLDIGSNDISVGDIVQVLTNYLTVMARVCKVVISQMYYSKSVYYICNEFNDKVFLYN